MSEMKARARRTDPATSHEAAYRVEVIGKAGSQRHQCYHAVILHPGKTASEIDRLLNFSHEVAHKRLPELRDGGAIKTGPERICTVRGSMCLTWYWVDSREAQQGGQLTLL